jgi:hypothetical protein
VVSGVCPSASSVVSLYMSYSFRGLDRRSWVGLTPRMHRFLCRISPHDLIMPPR